MKNICFLTSSFNKKNIHGYNFYNNNKVRLKFNKTNKTLNQKEIKKIVNSDTIGILSGNEILDQKLLKNYKNLSLNALKKSKKWSYNLISKKYLKFINSTF